MSLIASFPPSELLTSGLNPLLPAEPTARNISPSSSPSCGCPDSSSVKVTRRPPDRVRAVTSAHVRVVLQVWRPPVASSTCTPACLTSEAIPGRHGNGRRPAAGGQADKSKCPSFKDSLVEFCAAGRAHRCRPACT